MRVIVGKPYQLGDKEFFRIMFEGCHTIDLQVTECPYLGGNLDIEEVCDLHKFLGEQIRKYEGEC